MKERSLADLFHLVGEAVPPPQKLETIPSDTKVRAALRLMLDRGFSQLPVMAGSEVYGVFSFRSLARGLIKLPERARDPLSLPVEEFMEDLKFSSVKDELSSVLDEFYLMDAILVGSREKLQGIVTTSDALQYFYTVASPYVMLREIELAIRALISSCVTDEELRDCIDKSLAAHYKDSGKPPPSCLEEMSFHDYVNLLRFQGTWNKFKINFGESPDIVHAKLEPLPRLRNAVFHFRRELSAEEYDLLRTCRDWLLKRVRKLDATKLGDSGNA